MVNVAEATMTSVSDVASNDHLYKNDVCCCCCLLCVCVMLLLMLVMHDTQNVVCFDDGEVMLEGSNLQHTTNDATQENDAYIQLIFKVIFHFVSNFSKFNLIIGTIESLSSSRKTRKT
jgi:hypothetical protein